MSFVVTEMKMSNLFLVTVINVSMCVAPFVIKIHFIVCNIRSHYHIFFCRILY